MTIKDVGRKAFDVGRLTQRKKIKKKMAELILKTLCVLREA